MASPSIVLAIMDCEGTIAFERHMGDVPRLITVRGVIKSFLKRKFDFVVVEHADFDLQVGTSIVRFCHLVEGDIQQEGLMPMPMSDLLELPFAKWGYPLKCKGIQGAIWKYQTFLEGIKKAPDFV